MKTTFEEMKQNQHTANRVIRRGSEIYDEWIQNRYSSRKIASFAQRVLDSAQTKRTGVACVEALSCLFALDTRIQKNYSRPLQRVFSYFSWRRETRIFRRLKKLFHMSDCNLDIRTAIEVELKKLRKKLEAEEIDDKSDEAHGGKQNAKGEEDLASAKGKEQSQASKDTSTEHSKKEETIASTEEKADTISEQKQNGEPAEYIEEHPKSNTSSSKDAENSIPENNKQKKEEINNTKEKNNTSNEKHSSEIDKPKESKSYTDAIDSPPIQMQSTKKQSPKEDSSFIDEVIMDNTVKGKENAIRHNPLEDVVQAQDLHRADEAAHQGNEGRKNADATAYLYDKMVLGETDEASQQTEKIGKATSTQTKEKSQKEHAEATGETVEDLRVPLQVDITLDHENELRRDISNNMSVEAIQAIYESQAATMREQLNIASEELGIDAPVEIIGRPETTPPEQSLAGPNRK